MKLLFEVIVADGPQSQVVERQQVAGVFLRAETEKDLGQLAGALEGLEEGLRNLRLQIENRAVAESLRTMAEVLNGDFMEDAEAKALRDAADIVEDKFCP